jgi:hypothetical protein
VRLWSSNGEAPNSAALMQVQKNGMDSVVQDGEVEHVENEMREGGPEDGHVLHPVHGPSLFQARAMRNCRLFV